MNTTNQTAVDALRVSELWTMLFAPYKLDYEQVAIWLAKHDVTTVRQALASTGIRFLKLNKQMSPDYIVRYSSSIMNRITAQS
jgi:hypothetical protein